MKEEIDYNSKILNFLAMAETNDQIIAAKYLEENDWDETKAVNKFFSSINENSNDNNLINDNIDQINNFNDTNRSINELINDNMFENNKTKNSNKKKENILYKYCVRLPYQFLLNCCSDNREISKSEEKKIFRSLPNLMNDFIEFCLSLKSKIGIIVFYEGNNINFLKYFIAQLSRSTNCINLMKRNFMIYPILNKTKDVNKIQDLINNESNNNRLLLPSFIFCFNKHNNKNQYLDSILNKNHIIFILQGESTNLNSFYSALKQTSNEYLDKNINDINSTEFLDKSFGTLTDGEILNKQKYEMEALEKEVHMKEEQLTKEKKEELLIEKEIEKKKKEALSKLVEEPDIDNPDITTICFRYPDGERIKNRRFLKSHKIQNLYDFVASLGEEIYTEKENKSFSLFQPFPPKKYENMENTLEQENLVSNAVIQIREE